MTMYRLVFVFLISGSVLALAAASGEDTSSSRPPQGSCLLPEYPEHGTYVVLEQRSAQPGQSLAAAVLNYTCHEGYDRVGRNQIFCVSGMWSEPFPHCTRSCKLDKQPNVLYYCTTADGKKRDCGDSEPSGGIVEPRCHSYSFSNGPLLPMKCVNGEWDYVATCAAECGKIYKEDLILLSGNRNATSYELPWHAGIYTKLTKPYKQFCGGTLITTTVVLSAAHCFWGMDSMLPKEDYAVALGKIYMPWDNKYDDHAHKSDVKDIHIPPLFKGQATNYQSDIAMVVMEKSVTYRLNIRPVCVDFDIHFEKLQLREGSLGKVGGWHINSVHGNSSGVLKVAEIPYIDEKNCFSKLPEHFRPYVTADKMCAESYNDTVLCKGDSGGGIFFPTHDKGVERYYLRGIMSAAPVSSDGRLCEPSIIAFTRISQHENFIKLNWLP